MAQPSSVQATRFPTRSTSLTALALLLVLPGPGCHLLGLATDVPCTTTADCPTSTPQCVAGVCAAAEGEGEGEGAGEGEGEGAGEGEGEGAGEGEGEGAGEGEGEGEGAPEDPNMLFRLVPKAGADPGATFLGTAAAFTVTAADCDTNCDPVAGPGDLVGGVPQNIDIGVNPSSDKVVFEAVLLVPPAPQVGSLLDLPLQTANIQISTRGSANGRDLVLALGDIALSQPLPVSARGWFHVMCAVDLSIAHTTVPTNADVQCFVNGGRLEREPDNGTPPVVSTPGAVSANTAFIAIRVWDAFDVALPAPSTAALFDESDALERAVRGRLATWAGVAARVSPLVGTSTLLPFDLSEPALAVLGPLASLSDTATPVVWLLPGWPRVVDDEDGRKGVLLEAERLNALSPADVDAAMNASGCVLAAGPSGEAGEARTCSAGGTFTFHPGSSAGTFSVFVKAADGSAVSVGACSFTVGQAPTPGCGARDLLVSGWHRYSAASANTVAVTVAGAASVALPQVDQGSVVTSPLQPLTVAFPDVMLYPVGPTGIAGLEMKADVNVLASGNNGLVSALLADARPFAGVTMLLDAGTMVLAATGNVAPVQTAAASGIHTYAARVRATGSATPCAAGCSALSITPAASSQTPEMVMLGGGPSDGRTGGDVAEIIRELVVHVDDGTAPSPPAPLSFDFTNFRAAPKATTVANTELIPLFDARAGSVAAPWIGVGTPVFTPAPGENTAGGNLAFQPKATAGHFSTSPAGNLTGNSVIVEALFEVNPAVAAQNIVTVAERQLSLQINPVVPSLGFTDGAQSFKVAPTSDVLASYDGWVHVVCAHTPGAATAHCLVNAQDAVVTPGGTSPAVGVGSTIGSANGAGGIAFVSIVKHGTGVNPDDAVATITRRFFGIEDATAPATFARASVATAQYINAGRLVVFDVGVHWPRTSRLSVSDGIGYLSEAPSQNLLLRSVDMRANAWSNNNVSTAQGADNGPRPLAERFLIQSGNNVSQTVTLPVGGAATTTFTASAAFRSTGTLTVDAGGGSSFSATISNAGCATVTAGATCAAIDLGGGWKRFAVTGSVTSTGSATFRLAAGNNDGEFSMPQLELSPVVTSYVPTAATSVVRAAEQLSLALAGPVASGGTFTVSATLPTTGTGGAPVMITGFAGTNRPVMTVVGRQATFPDVPGTSEDDVFVPLGGAGNNVTMIGQWSHTESLLTAGTTTAFAAHALVLPFPPDALIIGTPVATIPCTGCLGGVSIRQVDVTFETRGL